MTQPGGDGVATTVPSGVRLTESCREIVTWATRGGTRTLTTRDLLVAVMSADTEADWQRVWLYAGSPEQLNAVLASEAEGTVGRAFRVADAVRSNYRADAVTPAMLALGLVGVPGSGAAQAVRSQGGIGPDRFADLVGEHVIRLRLGASLAGIAADASGSTQTRRPPPPVAPNPLARAHAPADPRWTPARRSAHRLGRWLLVVATAMMLGGLFPLLRNTGSTDAGVSAIVGGLVLGIVGLFAVLPRWRHRTGLRPPPGVRSGVWTARVGWAVVAAGAGLAFVPSAHLVAAAVAGAGLSLLTFGYGRALLAMPAADRRVANRVDTVLLAVVAAGMPALLLGWLGWAVLGSGDHAARYGAKVEVVEVKWCNHTLPRAPRSVFSCTRAAWTGDGPGLRWGTFYYGRDDARPGRREFDPKAVPAYAIGNRAFGPGHVGAIDPIVVLAPATPWLGLAVPVVVLCAVIVSWRRTPRRA